MISCLLREKLFDFCSAMKTPDGFVPLADYLSLREELENTKVVLFRALKKIDELEARLNKNSNNSSKPPSSDNYKKSIKNNREKGKRKPGGQPGHKGSGLSLFTEIDKTLECKVEGKCECGKDLEKQKTITIEKRQVIDLPEKPIEVRELHVEVKQCSCGKVHKGKTEYNQGVQYGNKIKSFFVYLNTYQQIPMNRLQEFAKDIFGLSISDGLIQSATGQCSLAIEKPLQQIEQGLLEGEVMHVDETSARCESKTSWLHSASNLRFTLYFFHLKRGNEAMNAMGLLPVYKGTIVHDRWFSYYKYDCTHALCNAHLLRDLKFMHEEMNRKWAEKLKLKLQEANDRKKSGTVTSYFIAKIKREIKDIVTKAIKKEPKQENIVGKRGRKSKGKAICLLEVFRDRINEVLLFLKREEVPFDNNLAERDLRMMKLKQKISGCFRTEKGVEIFCRIRSYISSVKKQSKNVWDALANAMNGKPTDLLNFH